MLNGVRGQSVAETMDVAWFFFFALRTSRSISAIQIHL